MNPNMETEKKVSNPSCRLHGYDEYIGRTPASTDHVAGVVDGDEVHVWRIDLDGLPAAYMRGAATLSPDERDRAKRFHFEKDRQRYVNGRAMLRRILGYYLRCEPTDIQFSYDPNGKPGLAGRSSLISGLSFNLSHAQSLALCAVTRNRSIGIDVEYTCRSVDVETIARKFFSPEEYAMLMEASPRARQHLFFRFWTAKEAFLKATGSGLSQLRDAIVSFRSPGNLCLLSAGCWRLYELSLTAGFAGAVVIAGEHHDVRGWFGTSGSYGACLAM